MTILVCVLIISIAIVLIKLNKLAGNLKQKEEQYNNIQKKYKQSIGDIDIYLNLIDELTKSNNQKDSEIEILKKKLDFYLNIEEDSAKLNEKDDSEEQKKLIEEEKSIHTIKKYRRDILKFYKFLPKDKCINKERMIGYKMYLKENYKIVSANSMLVAVNRFLEYICLGEYKVRQFKVPRVFFCRESRFMSKAEYERMVKAAAEKRISSLA